MKEERFLEIMNDYEEKIKTDLLAEPGCHVLKGLNIIVKYLPEKGIEGSGNDFIFSCNVDELIESGITEIDAIALRRLNWSVEEDSYLYTFV